MEEPQSKELTYQRALFNYKLKWDNNDLEWLDVANAIIKTEVEVELTNGESA